MTIRRPRLRLVVATAGAIFDLTKVYLQSVGAVLRAATEG